MIITANVFFKASLDAYKIELVRGMQRAGLVYTGLIEKISEPMKAYANHGKWLVKCECGGCEKAWEEGQFMCQSCWNAGHKHKLRRVIMPAERSEIEALLEVRPLINRNWRPGETMQFLEIENVFHKEELLEVR